MSGLRFPVVGCYVRREPGLLINCNCVDCEAMCGLCWNWLLIKCLNVLRAKPPPFYVIKFLVANEGEFEKW